MKKAIDGKVALQRYDVGYLLHELVNVPRDVIDEIIVGRMAFVRSWPDDYGFNCVFERPESVEWIMAQDCIVDYDEYDHVSVIGLEYKLAKLRVYYGLMDCYDLHSDGYFMEFLEEPGNKNNPRIHELASFAILHWARTNRIDFAMPDLSQKFQKRQSLIQKLFNLCAR